jgi:uncharacterized protein (TIGR00369 family)
MSEPDDASGDRRATPVNRALFDAVPHNRALGIEAVEFAPGIAAARLPWRDDLVGNPDTGVLHGGAITALIDACCGASVFQKLRRPQPIATLDLRIDYLKPAVPRLDVIARAECYRVTRNVAFVRGIAYQDHEDRPIASAAGAFMLGTRRGRRRGPA